MATWVTHFRIAEALLKTEVPVSRVEFLVGNIGPDCGLIGEDKKPQPPKRITHFKVNGNISADYFYKQYLEDQSQYSIGQYSYLLGYYIHLLTDEEWIKFTDQQKQQAQFEAIVNTPEYARNVKREWYGVDFLYLKNHQDHIFWTEFQYIEQFPEYLDIIPTGQTLTQIKNITKFYQTSTIQDDHEFIYLTPAETDEFVENTIHIAKEILQQRITMEIP